MRLYSITVFIATCNRPESLRITLDSLIAADRKNMDINFIVVDNLGCEKTKEVVENISEKLDIIYLIEEKKGKACCLEKAMRQKPQNELVAIIDDDITVEREWFNGIQLATSRWPEKGYYTGRILLEWPKGIEIPAWAKDPSIHSWAYSVFDHGDKDYEISAGGWAPGGFFWFRSKLLSDKTDIFTNDTWGDAIIMLYLGRLGYGGVAGPDAVVHHRIQGELLSLPNIRRRSFRIGGVMVSYRFYGLGRDYDVNRMMCERPIYSFIRSLIKLMSNAGRYVFSKSYRPEDLSKQFSLLATIGCHYKRLAIIYAETIRKFV